MGLTFVIMVIPSSILCEHTISLRHILSSDLKETCLCLLVEYTNSYTPEKCRIPVYPECCQSLVTQTFLIQHFLCSLSLLPSDERYLRCWGCNREVGEGHTVWLLLMKCANDTTSCRVPVLAILALLSYTVHWNHSYLPWICFSWL